MRRFTVLLTVLTVLMLSSAVMLSRPPAAAQEATPESATPAPELVMEGITIEDLASSHAPTFPSRPVDVALVRLHFAPGGRLVAPPVEDQGVALILVESGTITVSSTDVMLVTRGETLATPDSAASEQVPAETDVTLAAGDSVLAAPSSGGDFRNEGTGEASLLFTLLTPVQAGTPTP